MGLILAKLYIIEEEKEKAVEEFETSEVELPRATPNHLNRAWIESKAQQRATAERLRREHTELWGSD